MASIKTFQIVFVITFIITGLAVFAFYGAGAYIALHFIKKIW